MINSGSNHNVQFEYLKANTIQLGEYEQIQLNTLSDAARYHGIVLQ